ncbi:Cysteine synthase [Rhynchospora pubera]|uniref:cysteine synthase n=1 Tax=Rhynchospora pubera TaxID=906938 RepID=A0AAV8C709_9POAL|nr:Cysteine synthase [Rhynchospora pubera]
MAAVSLGRAVGAATAALSISLIFCFLLYCARSKFHPWKKTRGGKRRRGLVEAIGNTPLIRINSLSDATGCEILGKAEFLNPGGSVKDRVAVKIIEEAIENGELVEGGIVTEGSAGSTAISLATVAPAFGCTCHVVIPDDAAIEKSQILEALGAVVERVRPVSITHKDHFVNIAKRRAIEANKAKNDATVEVTGHVSHNGQSDEGSRIKSRGGYFAAQFENLANYRAHYEWTGPEIWNQTKGSIHAFVAAAGTGGTIAGVSRFLKEKNKCIKCFLIDPPGSGLFNKVTRGVMYTKEEAEGKRLKNPFDTITEGIGINRVTKNFMMAELDGAYRGTDQEAVEMSRFLLRNDDLFIGSSSAMNCVGAVRVARALGPGHTIVTILCDSGMRHLSKFFNNQYLAEHGLTPTATGLEFLS